MIWHGTNHTGVGFIFCYVTLQFRISETGFYIYVVCFKKNFPISKPYISAITNPRWMRHAPRQRPRRTVWYDSLDDPTSAQSAATRNYLRLRLVNKRNSAFWNLARQSLITLHHAFKWRYIPYHVILLIGIRNELCLCSTITSWLLWISEQEPQLQ